MALLRERKDFDSCEHVKAWLIRVTVSESKKWHRSPWRKHAPLEAYAASLPDATGQDREILEAVMALPRKYRLPIYLYYYEDYATQQIADILKIPKGTVCTYLSRGREMLKMEFREDEDDE